MTPTTIAIRWVAVSWGTHVAGFAILKATGVGSARAFGDGVAGFRLTRESLGFEVIEVSPQFHTQECTAFDQVHVDIIVR